VAHPGTQPLISESRALPAVFFENIDKIHMFQEGAGIAVIGLRISPCGILRYFRQISRVFFRELLSQVVTYCGGISGLTSTPQFDL
jgi:hypothetical protein